MSADRDRQIKTRAKFMQLIVPLLFLAGLVLISSGEIAKESWPHLNIVFTITSAIGASLFAGASVTALYNYFIKEIDTAELKSVIRNMLNRDDRIHRIIYFIPTLLQNEFYHELLHQLLVLTGNIDRRIDVVVKVPTNLNDPGIKYHDNDHGYMHELAQVDCDDNTLIVIVPCTPEFLKKIPEKLPNLRNIITLDMAVPQNYQKLFVENPMFLANIRTDNEEACHTIATNMLDYFEEKKLHEINAIICEGNFHARGLHFKHCIEAESQNRSAKVAIRFLPSENPVKPLNFGTAISDATAHVHSTFSGVLADPGLSQTPTFIFCANDNMGIGARNALTRLRTVYQHDQKALEAIINTKIICYDYSSTIRNFIKNGDVFICFSGGQDYRQFAQKIVDIASKLEKGRRGDPDRQKKMLLVPSIFRRQ